jgi:DNA-binding Xre family transcriptional regulator
VDDRPDHALLLAEEVYAAFDSLPAELRQMIDEKFRRMGPDLDPLRRSSMSDKETLGEGRRQIGMKLRAAREEAEMELVELSVRTGFSEEEIEAIENGEQMIYQKDLMVLCTALNVSPKDIVGRSTN